MKLNTNRTARARGLGLFLLVAMGIIATVNAVGLVLHRAIVP